MNIISAITGLVIMGAAAPGVMEMSIQPFMAQNRAQNFGIAESAAVTFAAAHEGGTIIPGDPPDGCEVAALESRAYEIACKEGEGQFLQTVSRSFRLNPTAELTEADKFYETNRTFNAPPPPGFTPHQCHDYQDWGLNTNAFDRETNTWRGKSCMPTEIWALVYYSNSNPDSWRYDINNWNGWGSHEDY